MTTGLSDNSRAGLGILIYSLIAISAYVASTPELRMLVIPFAIAAIVAGIAKDKLGIKEAAIAEVANRTDNSLRTSKSVSND